MTHLGLFDPVAAAAAQKSADEVSRSVAALASADAWLKPRDLLLGQSAAALGGASVATIVAFYAWSYSLYTGELAAEAAAMAAKKAAKKPPKKKAESKAD